MNRDSRYPLGHPNNPDTWADFDDGVEGLSARWRVARWLLIVLVVLVVGLAAVMP